MGERISSFKDLRVYKLAFEIQQGILDISKRFLREERYALTDQIRRASRSIGANISEAWQKRRYVAHFVSKLTDADGEQAESQHWLDTAAACDYIPDDQRKAVLEKCLRIGQMLGTMMASLKSAVSREVSLLSSVLGLRSSGVIRNVRHSRPV
ncbi:MAG: four helix bundle protein [Verrucomicrobia bacterium]|nr:MAG: four helix bundle protein [Verrucomicrobiota bacterium]